MLCFLSRRRLHAFIYDATVLEYQAGRDADCRLITVGKWYAMSGYGIAFRPGSPWRHKINKVILELLQKGQGHANNPGFYLESS
jgi:ABC-type amino acid transport substrate-binding protein